MKSHTITQAEMDDNISKAQLVNGWENYGEQYEMAKKAEFALMTGIAR